LTGRGKWQEGEKNMKSIRQLTRQGLKTLAGILLAAIAVTVLCVSFSQKLAAEDTSRQLQQIYMTVALPTGAEVPNRATWIQGLIDDHPELVRYTIRQGLASAYIPALTPDNHTQHKNQNDDAADQTNNLLQPATLSYGGAMLEAELKQHPEYLDDATAETWEGAYFCQLEFTVIRAIGLQEGYHDPADFTLRIQLTMPSYKAYCDLDLQVGQRYLIYGNNYQDLDWQLRDNMAEIMVWNREETLPDWDMSTLVEFGGGWWGNTRYKCMIGDLYHGLTEKEMQYFRTATLTVADQSSFAGNSPSADYTVPTIAKLEGTAEEFLSGSEGAIWQKALEDIEINCHSFPIIGTDDLKSVAAFSLGRADVAFGRSFSPEEIQSGAKVCVISRYLADAHGLKVGDTLDLSYFTYDFDNPYQQFISNGQGIVNPIAYSYFSAAMEMKPTERYTIVGLYEQDSPWGSVENDLYSFSPNTIFVPHASVTGSMDYANEGQFLTLVIHNDKLQELQLYSVENNMDGVFEYYDNDYNTIANTLENYEAAADRILPIGIVVYLIVIALFLFLFPGREGGTLSRMDSMGAGHVRRVWHVVLSAMGILLPASAIGAAVSIGLWQQISDALQEFMQTDITISLDISRLWLVAAVQAAGVALAVAGLGGFLSARVNPMRKR
jgi:hypothetical protein